MTRDEVARPPGEAGAQAGARAANDARALRAVKLSLLGLLATAAAQAVVVAVTGSAALLADTIHNFSNVATTIPLWIAFSFSRRRESLSFPYGYHRGEDLAGLVIVVLIAVSAGVIGYESVQKLLARETPRFVGLAMAAGGLGFLGNEAVAQYRIRVGKAVGSPSLVADGHHARTDGLSSLAVVVGLGAVALGYPIADPIVGLAITALILHILVREAGPPVLARMMDRMDGSTVVELERAAREVPGVLHVHEVRARWAGRRMLAEMSIHVPGHVTVAQGHLLAETVHHALLHRFPFLYRCVVHVEPDRHEVDSAHDPAAHHFAD